MYESSESPVFFKQELRDMFFDSRFNGSNFMKLILFLLNNFK